MRTLLCIHIIYYSISIPVSNFDFYSNSRRVRVNDLLQLKLLCDAAELQIFTNRCDSSHDCFISKHISHFLQLNWPAEQILNTFRKQEKWPGLTRLKEIHPIPVIAANFSCLLKGKL